MKPPPRLGDTVSPDDDAPIDAANGVDDVLAETVEQVEKLSPPQDRMWKLITDEGPTE